MNDRSVLIVFGKFLEGEELPSLGPEPRPSRISLPVLEKQLNDAFLAANTPPQNKQLIRSLVLLWHDHLDESHSLSQEIHTIDGSFAHGIMHRREPDYSNAKYWFNRVGQHPAFFEIARRVETLLRQEPTISAKLIPNGKWDAFAFVDACEEARKSSSAEIAILQRIQEIETRVLLESFCR